MNEIFGIATVGAADINGSVSVKLTEKVCSCELDMSCLRAKLCAFVRCYCVNVFGSVAHKYELTAVCGELLKKLEGGRSDGLASGNYDNVVFHFADLDRVLALLAKCGKKRFADVVKVDRAEEEPVGNVLKALVELLTLKCGLRGGTPVYPKGFNGVDNANLDVGRTANERGVYSCKVIFDVGIFIKPRGLIADGCGIVALCLAFHGNPREVRNAESDTECRLPVTLHLVTSEVVIPTGYAVKLTHNALATVLVRNGRSLLCGGILVSVGEHINAGDLECAERTHSLADCHGLRIKRGLLHHMTGKSDSVCLAPITDVVGEACCKSLASVVVIEISDLRNAVRKLPDKLGKMLNERLSVGSLEGILKIGGPRKSNVNLGFCKRQSLLVGELRFIGEYGGDNSAEHIADAFLVSFVSDLDESVDSLLVHRVNVCITVVTGGLKRRLVVSVPNLAYSLAFVLNLLIGRKRTFFVENDIVLSDKLSSARTGSLCLLVADVDLAAYLFIGIGSEEKIIDSVLRILGNKSAGKAGGPSVLVVKICEHIFLFGFFCASADEIHKLIRKIFGSHTRTNVHMEAAESHYLEHFDLTEKLILVKLAVPSPEGSAAVFGCGFFK